MIPFNKPFIIGNELKYIEDAVKSGKISGDGIFTKKCQDFFQDKYSFPKVLLTTSCTDALEMAAILCDIKAGDEVIVPSYTFVSSANAFALRGAKIIFADSYSDNPNVNPDSIEKLITNKTKAIVPVHYAGVACDMEKIMDIAKEHNLFVIEDAAQAIDSYYTFSDGTKKPTDLAPPKKPNNDDDMVIIIPCELLYKNTLNPSLISLSALLILIAPTPDK